MISLSIITPTYNRAYLLQNVYNSLLVQTNENFEWLVVDGGSTDNTKILIDQFIQNEKFPTKYIWQKNSGKHIAVNRGVANANGSYLLILDSDDTLTADAVQMILDEAHKIDAQPNIAGIAGRRIFQDGTIVGNKLPQSIIATSLAIRYQYSIIGDLVEVFKTEVLKKFPFPEYIGEKFCPEALLWNRIAQKYSLLFTNKGFYITQYLAGGLTDNIIKIRMKSPQASMTHYAELASYKIPLIQKIKATINFWRFAFCEASGSIYKRWRRVNFFISLFALPIGYFMHSRDLIKVKD